MEVFDMSDWAIGRVGHIAGGVCGFMACLAVSLSFVKLSEAALLSLMP